MTDRSALHADGCICAQGAGGSYCNCGVAVTLERGSTLGAQEIEIDRLRAENERLREAARETLGAIEDRWDGTEKSPLWGIGDALETALESDEILLTDPEEGSNA